MPGSHLGNQELQVRFPLRCGQMRRLRRRNGRAEHEQQRAKSHGSQEMRLLQGGPAFHCDAAQYAGPDPNVSCAGLRAEGDAVAFR